MCFMKLKVVLSHLCVVFAQLNSVSQGYKFLFHFLFSRDCDILTIVKLVTNTEGKMAVIFVTSRKYSLNSSDICE